MADVNDNPVVTPRPVEAFGSDEPLWYQNGRWGDAGYAMPNPGGKLWCLNESVWAFVQIIGRGLFHVMHEEDRRFIKPLGKDILWDIYQLITVARKRVADLAVKPGEPEFRSEHNTPAMKEFLLYPVPYFGDTLRNEDLRRYCSIMLGCLTECMQHTEADKTQEITAPGFGAMVGKHLWRILFLVATKYFGYKRTDLYDPANNQPRLDFDLKIEDWKNFDYTKIAINFELTEERHDLGWIPTENDLRAVRGIPASIAMQFAARFPTGGQAFTGGLRFGLSPGEKPTGSIGSMNASAFPAPPGPPA